MDCINLKTSDDLKKAMFTKGDALVEILKQSTTPDKYGKRTFWEKGILQSVQREDGSGLRFNLTIRRFNGQLVVVYFKCEE